MKDTIIFDITMIHAVSAFAHPLVLKNTFNPKEQAPLHYKSTKLYKNKHKGKKR